MTAQGNIIEQIIAAFDQEMRAVERFQVMADIASGNPPSSTDSYNRQMRKGRDYDEQRAALRRVLSRFLPSDSAIKEQLRPTVEKAMQEVAEQFERALNK